MLEKIRGSAQPVDVFVDAPHGQPTNLLN